MSAPRPESLPRRTLRWLAIAASAGWLLALLLRFTIQDRVPGLAVLFYASPWLVLAGSAPVLALGWWMIGRRRFAVLAVVAGVLCLGAWWRLNIMRNPEPPERPRDGIRVYLLNARHPKEHNWAANIAEIQPADADIIGLVEADIESAASAARFRAGFPGYAVEIAPNNLILAVRGEILETRQINLGADSRCQISRVRVKGRDLTILLVDLSSFPRNRRGPWFRQLDELLRPHANESVIVMGDFNTPRESAFFRPWRERFHHAFETVGRGPIDTFPAFPFPVLCIDHVWTSPDLRLVRCERWWDELHDHCAIVTDLAP